MIKTRSYLEILLSEISDESWRARLFAALETDLIAIRNRAVSAHELRDRDAVLQALGQLVELFLLIDLAGLLMLARPLRAVMQVVHPYSTKLGEELLFILDEAPAHVEARWPESRYWIDSARVH